MFGPMHKIAAQRGDGLRPEFLELFARSADNVVYLSDFLPRGFTQSGPDPKQALPETLPSNVVLFSRVATSDPTPAGRQRLTPRIGRAKRLTHRRD